MVNTKCTLHVNYLLKGQLTDHNYDEPTSPAQDVNEDALKSTTLTTYRLLHISGNNRMYIFKGQIILVLCKQKQLTAEKN